MIDPGLDGRAALVTGANNPMGIGAAIARALAAQGVRVFLHYHREFLEPPDGPDPAGGAPGPGLHLFCAQQRKTADEVVASIRQAGGSADSWEADLQEAGRAELLLRRAEAAFGRVDILVNNAAAYAADSFLPAADPAGEERLWEGGPSVATVDAASHDLHFAVNTRATALLTAGFARRLLAERAGWGRIVNISADCARGCPQEISYRASKYALESYSRSAAAELGPHGITVNAVSPGPVQSGYIAPELEAALVPEIPLRRIGRPEDIADAVVFLASAQAGWITGQVLLVHGGHRLALGR
jgi:3-oxoacyl-[acyl-carrier protein] reductase